MLSQEGLTPAGPNVRANKADYRCVADGAERLTPVGPNIYANKRGYEETADTFEAIVDPR